MRIERDQIVTLGAISGLAILFVLGGWLPMQNRRSQADRQAGEISQQLSGTRQGATGLAKLARDVQALKDQVGDSPRYVPQEGELAGLLRQLSSELADQQVQDQMIQTQSMVSGEDFNLMPVRLTFRGTFPATFAFLRHIEYMDRVVQVNRLEVDGTAGADKPLNVILDLSTFSAPMGGGS